MGSMLDKLTYWNSKKRIYLRINRLALIERGLTRRPPFWCGKCLELSLNLRRRALWQNLRRLASASASVMDDAKEESPSVRQGRRLSPLRALRRRRAKGGQLSLRDVANELAARGFLNERGKPYAAKSVASMLD